MEWLENELEVAASAHEKVWLMFHIPPGIDGYASAMKQKKLVASGNSDAIATCAQAIVPMWKVQFTERFDWMLEKYHDTVTAAFAAHIHSDDYRLIGAPGANRVFVLLDPAISPIYSQNPAFRVVSYRADGTIADHTTYYLTNLPQATATKKGRWKKEYQYTRQWHAGTVSGASLGEVYERVVKNADAQGEWLKLYAVSGPALEGQKPIVRSLYCAVEGLTVEEYRECWCGGQNPQK
jgi:hypothetical protein